MSEVKYRVCDKCGERLDHSYWPMTRVAIVRLPFEMPDSHWYGQYDYELRNKFREVLQEHLNAPGGD